MKSAQTEMTKAQSRFTQHVALTADTLFHGKWKLHILCAMQSGPIRLGQLGRLIPRASKKVLTQSLRELEASGIVLRKDLSDIVLHIEYELRPDVKDGVSFLLERLAQWGEAYLKDAHRAGDEDTGTGPRGET
jgi:DNA-binding HxlR family transcriptional regulator